MGGQDEVCDVLTVSILGKPSIRMGFHLSSYIAKTVIEELPSSAYVLITDTNLSTVHAPLIAQEFRRRLPESSRFLSYFLSPGEQSKSRETKANIEDWLLDQRCTRDTVILALGGGVVGDLTGFIAATFMRGLRFCQIPTTLLAMVDSSVGGKTAVDTPLGKNLIGAFWQPSFIFMDASYLETLPEREFVNGMAELIKTAAIWDESMFVKLEANVDSIRSAVLSPPPRDPASGQFPGRTLATRSESQKLLLEVIKDSVSVKSEVVTIDETETGLRNLVNFGHTLGHAIEAVLTPHILHGECVSIGMVLEAELARALGHLTSSAVARLSKCLKSHGLPISLSDQRIVRAPKSSQLELDHLLDLMSVDKKNAGKLKKVVLLSRIGKTVEERATGVEDDLIRRILAPSIRVFPGPPPPKFHKLKLSIPGSKSISNRALAFAALGKGTCKLKNLLHSDDTQVMISALEQMNGASFSWEDNGTTLVVSGGDGSLKSPSSGHQIYLGNAGTAARFLTSICTLIKPDPSGPGSTVLNGNSRMQLRPIGPLVDALRSNGIVVDYLACEGCLPLRIGHQNYLAGGEIELSASISSQYVSSILMAAPYAQQPVTLSLVGGVVISQPYIDMTISMMDSFGIKVQRLTDPKNGSPLNVYKIPKGTYNNPTTYEIESDASSATYPLALAALNGLDLTLESIGSNSLQGDAQFAKKVLEPMGCKVIQTERSTQVIGPQSVSQLRQLGDIDMETMTDAFLTAAVLLGVATQPSVDSQAKSTKIYGIANQRVKECNRVAAMVKELGKVGVRAEELEDGIEVFGTSIDALKQTDETVRIDCYDDHRVAMAFSVLGTVPSWKGLILNEKRCVEKTWPAWWDDFSGKMGFRIQGVPADESHRKTLNAAWEARKPKSPTILICGMRGSGKTFSGQTAASTLGWPLIDADLYFQDKYKVIIREYVKTHGWEKFRTEELKVLREIMAQFPTEHVISLGGGIVETEEARSVLSEYANSVGPVIQITRPVQEIIDYLDLDGSRPGLNEPIEQIWARREPWYRACSNSEYYNLACNSSDHTEESVESAKRAMRQFFRFITGVETNHVPVDPPVPRKTHFLSLTFPSFNPYRKEDESSLERFEEITTGCDAVELRVDLLSPIQRSDTDSSFIPIEFVSRQISALRMMTTLPIIYTVRTISQGGKFPNDRQSELLELVELGIRTGCEYVDVELGHPSEVYKAINRKKGYSKILASFHDFSGQLKWDSVEIVQKYHALKAYGDMVKIVSRAIDGLEDNFALINFRNKISTSPLDQQSLVTINMGRRGQMSRILSPVFSPTTHPLLPGPPAAPGQLSFNQIQTALELLGQIGEKSFWLFGNPIGHSRSPLIHQTGFDALGLKSYKYRAFQTDTVSESSIQDKIHATDFGGASVTIPFKVEIIKYLDRLTPDAQAVGAVNTIVPVMKRDGKVELLGANTDWSAIQFVIASNLPVQKALGIITPGKQVRAAGVVIGAGGTARAAIYALHSLGFEQIYLCNRTRNNAESLVNSFPKNFAIRVIEDLKFIGSGSENGWLPSVIISAVPLKGTKIEDDGSEKLNDDGGKILIPKSLFGRDGGGVVIDMSYSDTFESSNFTKVIKDLRDWRFVSGVEVLVEQGARQFRMWTGKRLPVKLAKKVVIESLQK
ncbi:EPSP synthase-domain-containing protein [Phakopsora pachyrhizi]|uniref:Pentafunctional AROM polypeptide n=1 Tax=Phakopsora pachyrhizi TaxID=170000 RepID=A0AAV0BLX0_PHAPC|nr:EPSP synthase-domain-containing protein [Phakopsora pachyrhizi]CAH7687096.1 EPSP synthase-domain-containing protein [Phakopsora pachyrhizi]